MPTPFTPSGSGLTAYDLLATLTRLVQGDPLNEDDLQLQTALTSIASGSNGVLLSAATSLDVASITGFNPSGGKAYIATLGAVIAYTGITSGPPIALTGVSVVSGSGTLATGMVVANIVPTNTGTGGPNLTLGWLANASALLARYLFPTGEVVLNAPWSSSGGAVSPVFLTMAAGSNAGLTLDLPVGLQVSGFKVGITPGSHTTNWPPANAPTLAFYGVNAATGTGIGTPIASVTDSLTSQSAYEATHDLELDLHTPVTIAAGTIYYITFTQESGLHSMSGFLYAGRGVFV